jgi:C-terminal processing protease CtpA/Prc
MTVDGLKTIRASLRVLSSAVVFGLTFFVLLSQNGWAQLDRIERERALSMLNIVKSDLKSNYYDPTFRGMDVEARFKTAEEKVKAATSLGQAFGIVAQTLLDLNDSHTVFIPPRRAETINYGWQMQMIGDKCFVVAVKPGSDAASLGLKEGDQVISVMGFKPSRKEFWKVRYYYNLISPRPSLRVVVQSPGAEPRELDIRAKVKPGSVVRNLTSDLEVNSTLRDVEDYYIAGRHRYYEDVGGVFVWKMPGFDLTDSGIDELVDKAKKRESMILDLRGNPGGAIKVLLRLIGNFFDKDMKLADAKERKQTKPEMAKARGKAPYTGKLFILIDSDSASCSELFARLMQLEKRGVVVGDLSDGAVMRAREYGHDLGADTQVSFSVGVTTADYIMSDGKSLEDVGVTPDELILPTGEDMAAKRDVVLARAFHLAGVTAMTPEKAGTLFPIIWEK